MASSWRRVRISFSCCLQSRSVSKCSVMAGSDGTFIIRLPKRKVESFEKNNTEKMSILVCIVGKCRSCEF